MKRLTKLLISFAMVLPLFLYSAPAVYADSVDDICAGVNIGSANTCGSGANNSGRIQRVVEIAVNIFTIIVGIIAVIMIIVSAVKFVASGGESSNINAARSTLLYAIVGLAVAALAQFLIRFVLFQVNK